MATRVFNSPADFTNWAKTASNTGITPDWSTDVAPLWPDSHNGDTGAIVDTLEPVSAVFTLAIFGNPVDDGSIPADATLDSFSLEFDWATTNSPDFVTDATSTIENSVTILDINQPEGIASGHFSGSGTAIDVLGSTVVADMYAAPFGWVYFGKYTGAFTGTITRRIAISNYVLTVTYTPVAPAQLLVDAGNEQEVTLTDGADLVGTFSQVL